MLSISRHRPKKTCNKFGFLLIITCKKGTEIIIDFFISCLEMITNDLTHGIAFENLAHEDDEEEVNRPRSGSEPVQVHFAGADDSDHSDKEVCQIKWRAWW